MDLSDLFDSYSRQARLQPALLTLFPLFVSAAVWFPVLYELAVGLASLAIACGAVVYLAHIARALGRKAEQRLFTSWGGMPTTLWLSHGDDNLDAQTKARYHTFLMGHIPGWVAPSLEDEATDRQSAEIAYESAVRWLRENTRDRKQYSLVFKENVSYGFRRNLYGLKPAGLWIASLSVAGNVWVLYQTSLDASLATNSPGVGSLILSLAVVGGWTIGVRPSWVKDSADGYARALLAVCDQIQNKKTS